MQEAAVVRDAAVEAVRDVVPDGLREEITGFVENGSVVPGALTLVVAETFGDVDPDGVDGLAERAVGVQLIYDGLRLTRTLSQEDSWSVAAADGEEDLDADLAADMEVLAATVLVSRGFYLLARSEAAGAAVEVVRSFGRDQTNRRERGDPSLDHELERDVIELAVLAGATAVGADAPDAGAFADGLVGDDGGDEGGGEGGFPPASELLTEAVTERLVALGDPGVDERPVQND